MPVKGNTAFVHIGMHKTGSTSIQMSFGKYASDTLVYPALGTSNHSEALSTIFKHVPESCSGHRRHKRTQEAVLALKDDYLARLEYAISYAGSRNMLVSGEDFVLLDAEEIANLRSYFLDRFQSIRIIGYVRPPASYMASALQQRIFGGASGQFVKLYPGYRKLFEKFDVVFGPENVTLIKFDRQRLIGADVVRDIAARMLEPADNIEIIEANLGRSLETTSAILAHRRFGEKSVENRRELRFNQEVVLALRTLGNSRIALHNDFVEQILELNRDDLEWIEKRLDAVMTEPPSTDGNALRRLEDLIEISGKQLKELGAVIASALAKADDDPVLVAHAVDFLYKIEAAKDRARRRKLQVG